MGDVSWDSSKAQYGGSDGTHEPDALSGNGTQEWLLRQGKVRHLNLSKPRSLQPSAPLAPRVICPSPLPCNEDNANVQIRVPSKPDSSEHDQTNENRNRDSVLPLPLSRRSPRKVKTGDSDHEHDSRDNGLFKGPTKSRAKSQSSFDIPLSWESLEELHPLADGVDDLAIAHHVEQMASLVRPIARDSNNRDSPPTACASAELSDEMAVGGETPDSCSPESMPTVLPEEETVSIDYDVQGGFGAPERASSPSPSLTPLANLDFGRQTHSRNRTDSSIRLVTASSSFPRSTTPIAGFPLTPPNSRPSSGIQSPIETLRAPPPSPQTPFGSPLKRPLPLTPTKDSKLPDVAAGNALGSSTSRTETYRNAYPTPNSSIGKK